MVWQTGLAGAALLFAAWVPEAFAQEQPITYKSLVQQGFQIKAVDIVSIDDQKAMGIAAPLQAQVLVTMQSGQATAICNSYASNYFNGLLDQLICRTYPAADQ